MNATAKKMSKIVDELIVFFFSVGSQGIKMDMQVKEDGIELTLNSRYDPAERKKVDDLERFLVVSKKERDKGLEEFFWELAGVSSDGNDSELHLIGQMLDRVNVEIGEDEVKLVLFKKKD